MNPAIAFSIGVVIITLIGCALIAIHDFFIKGDQE